MVPRMKRAQAATNIVREISPDVRWYVRAHIVTPNKNTENPYRMASIIIARITAAGTEIPLMTTS